MGYKSVSLRGFSFNQTIPKTIISLDFLLFEPFICLENFVSLFCASISLKNLRNTTILNAHYFASLSMLNKKTYHRFTSTVRLIGLIFKTFNNRKFHLCSKVNIKICVMQTFNFHSLFQHFEDTILNPDCKLIAVLQLT